MASEFIDVITHPGQDASLGGKRRKKIEEEARKKKEAWDRLTRGTSHPRLKWLIALEFLLTPFD